MNLKKSKPYKVHFLSIIELYLKSVIERYWEYPGNKTAYFKLIHGSKKKSKGKWETFWIDCKEHKGTLLVDVKVLNYYYGSGYIPLYTFLKINCWILFMEIIPHKI